MTLFTANHTMTVYKRHVFSTVYQAKAIADKKDMSQSVLEVHWAWVTCSRGATYQFFPDGLDKPFNMYGMNSRTGGQWLVNVYFVITYCDPRIGKTRRALEVLPNGIENDEHSFLYLNWWTFRWARPMGQEKPWLGPALP